MNNHNENLDLKELEEVNGGLVTNLPAAVAGKSAIRNLVFRSDPHKKLVIKPAILRKKTGSGKIYKV